jgi:cell shape-determining protein MreC
MIAEHIVSWILDALMITSIIISVKLRKKTRKIIDEIQQSSEERWNKFNEFVKVLTERVNLLSRENDKLREENEMLKERLRNIGITDFDVMN